MRYVNTTELRKMLEVAEKVPDAEFDMSVHWCGSVGCLLGHYHHAVREIGVEIDCRELDEEDDELCFIGLAELDETGENCLGLGITESTAEFLFWDHSAAFAKAEIAAALTKNQAVSRLRSTILFFERRNAAMIAEGFDPVEPKKASWTREQWRKHYGLAV